MKEYNMTEAEYTEVEHYQSEAEYMYQNEDHTIDEEVLYAEQQEDEWKLTTKSNELILELAIAGRRMKNGAVVLDDLSYNQLRLLAWKARHDGIYNKKYEAHVYNIFQGCADYFTKQKKRLTLMGYIRPFIDKKVKELFK